ncbi:hypothetical protein ACIGN6_21145 [Streptomyces sp. NPDC053792]|uniref:hypothetical protein n=1 Tax=Streptomyces sp. NPDC053792 TaxID=3365716 RepID=UPI0037D1C04C
MASLRTSFRRLRGVRRSPSVADVQFCDGCAEVTDRVARASARRRSQEAALTLHAIRV